jgi:hypothetical protein
MTPLFAADDAATRQLGLSRRLQLYYTFLSSTDLYSGILRRFGST